MLAVKEHKHRHAHQPERPRALAPGIGLKPLINVRHMEGLRQGYNDFSRTKSHGRSDSD
jgi:hypothetical protein